MSSFAAGFEQASDRRPSRLLLAFVVLLDVALGAGAVRHVVRSNFDADEVEHTHVIWSMNQGLLPYRDFHQVHTPLLWIVFAPVVKWMPNGVGTLVALRMLCLAAFAGSCAAGLLVLREALGRVSPMCIAAVLLVSLSALPELELYRFRPDPFMAFFTSCALLAAVRLRRAPIWYSMLGGVALGLAAGFSPKMAPLCLLVPTLCLFECARRLSLRPLWLVVPNGLGFALGILPAALWLFSNGLFDSFAFWSVSMNSHRLHCFTSLAIQEMMANQTARILAVAAVCGAVVAWRRRPPTRTAWPPRLALIVAALLTWLIMPIAPNYQIYNLQAFAIPAAALAAMFVAGLAQWDFLLWWPRPAVVGAMLLMIAGSPIARGVDMLVPGATISRSDLRKLMDLCRGEGVTCVGFAPWHPIFCRDATELYLCWDYWTADMPGARVTHRPYVDMWPTAVAAIENSPPRLIVDQRIWKHIHKSAIITDAQYDRFLRVIKIRYKPVEVGAVTAFVR